MLYDVRIAGLSPILHNSGDALVPNDWTAEKQQLTAKKGSNRTSSDDFRIKQLDCILALWLDADDKPTIPPRAVRATLENGARKMKQGPNVREGLLVLESAFEYDTEKYGTTLDELSIKTQFTTGVVVQRNRVLKTRAKFDQPWACEFVLDCDDELVDKEKLSVWLDIAGRRIGLGDWRPQKSGIYGRFEVDSITERSE